MPRTHAPDCRSISQWFGSMQGRIPFGSRGYVCSRENETMLHAARTTHHLLFQTSEERQRNNEYFFKRYDGSLFCLSPWKSPRVAVAFAA